MASSLLKDRFRITKRLGSGAFGETYLAEDTQRLNTLCVVKRLFTSADPERFRITKRLFDSEAANLNKLKHDGIPSLIAYFDEGGHFYLVQDYIDGRTLDHPDEISANNKWTESKVREFLIETLEILAYVHSQGSIHRDIKPDNMMRRSANGKLVLIDFGAVREVRQTPSNLAIGVASGTVIIGTNGYMPAEQAQGKPCYASDVYAIGCIAIEALIGESPYPNGFEIDRRTYEIRWRHRAQVSDEFAAIVDKMVRYDHRQRYDNAGEALAALQSLSSKKTSPQNPVTNPANKTPRPNPPVTSTRRKFIIGLAVATPLAIVGWENRPKPKTEITDPPKPTNPPSPPSETPRSTQAPTTEPTPKPTSSLRTETLNNIITVDASGKEINRRSVQVQYFAEDKISLPNGAKAIEMALIPAGEFKIGSLSGEKGRSDDENQVNYPIKFSQAFYISRYEVTQKQWFAVMGSDYDANGFNKRFRELDNKFKGDNRPMVVVDWNDAKAYCVKLSEKTGRSYRLPSEAEWEYSCRANTKTPFYFGETITAELVNHNSNYPYGNVLPNKSGYREVTTDVGSLPYPNEWGLYDMHGNVWEWCEDVWHENYNGIPSDGSAWLSGGDQTRRLLRGGSWSYFAFFCRSAYRFRSDTSNRFDSFGFRVAASSLS
ncbi:MAG: bifunctional serine/threonine-protein kinase/formylglycine-generating enzyme family protein [Pseudanabaena sp. ELA748]